MTIKPKYKVGDIVIPIDSTYEDYTLMRIVSIDLEWDSDGLYFWDKVYKGDNYFSSSGNNTGIKNFESHTILSSRASKLLFGSK